MLQALSRIHALGIVHRDVNPNNFLCKGESATVTLCDFGLAAVLPMGKIDRPVLGGISGTPPFMSPEMLNGRGYNAKTDIWSLGVIAYVIFVGTYPYGKAERNAQRMKLAIAAGVPRPTFAPKASAMFARKMPISASGVALLKTRLSREQIIRPSAQAVLHHPWFVMTRHGELQSSVSLWPMLISAKLYGAFECRTVSNTFKDEDMTTPGSMADLLQRRQLMYHSRAAIVSQDYIKFEVEGHKFVAKLGHRLQATSFCPDSISGRGDGD